MTANYDDVIPPIAVKIISDPALEKRPTEIRTSHRTIVLTVANPYALVAGNDPARREVLINVLDNPVILCGSISEASDVNNAVTGLTAPNGRIMPVGVDYKIPGQDDMYIAAATFPTRVGVTIVREI
jgi:hypothetical protein